MLSILNQVLNHAHNMPPRKRSRLLDLSTINVSHTSLAKIVSSIRDEGLPDAVSRSSLGRERQALADTRTPYGALVQHIVLPLSTGPEDVEVQAPLPMLFHLAETSVAFASLLERSLDRRACSPSEPWHLVLYADEVSPTNPLRTGVDHRMVQAIYWSLMEFGADALCQCDVWLVLATIRSELVTHLEGGMSHLVKLLLLAFFL